MSKKFRIPRKLKKQIPEGPYCYQGLRLNEKTFIYHVRPCPFYSHIKLKEKPFEMQDEIDKEYPEELIGWCKALEYEIDDQCKLCSWNAKYRR